MTDGTGYVDPFDLLAVRIAEFEENARAAREDLQRLDQAIGAAETTLSRLSKPRPPAMTPAQIGRANEVIRAWFIANPGVLVSQVHKLYITAWQDGWRAGAGYTPESLAEPLGLDSGSPRA